MDATAEDTSPYASFNASVEKRVRATYAGPMAAGPELVARAIEHAAAPKRPRSRYPLTAGACVLLATRRMLPDAAWDALMAKQFERPK